MNRTENMSLDLSEKICQLIAGAGKLPPSRRRRLLRFLTRFTELLGKKKDGAFDEEEQEELEVLAEGIAEMLAQEPARLVDHLVSPESPEAKKARQWFLEMGRRIYKLRKAKRLRQVDVAEKTGLSQGAVSRIERGLLAPTSVTVEKIAKALGVPPGKIDPGLE